MSELSDRVQAIAARSMARNAQVKTEEVARDEVRERKRLALREQMPEVAAWVDSLRDAGFSPVVLAASENGQSVVTRAACAALCVSVEPYV